MICGARYAHQLDLAEEVFYACAAPHEAVAANFGDGAAQRGSGGGGNAPIADVTLYTSMLTAYVASYGAKQARPAGAWRGEKNEHCLDKAWQLFHSMRKENVLPDEVVMEKFSVIFFNRST